MNLQQFKTLFLNNTTYILVLCNQKQNIVMIFASYNIYIPRLPWDNNRVQILTGWTDGVLAGTLRFLFDLPVFSNKFCCAASLLSFCDLFLTSLLLVRVSSSLLLSCSPLSEKDDDGTSSVKCIDWLPTCPLVSVITHIYTNIKYNIITGIIGYCRCMLNKTINKLIHN